MRRLDVRRLKREGGQAESAGSVRPAAAGEDTAG